MRKILCTYKIIRNRIFPDTTIHRIKLREPALLAAFWFMILLLDANGWFLLSLLMSIFHELGHVLVYRILVGEWPSLSVGFLGICMYTEYKKLPVKKELLITLAGPGTNLLLSLAVYFLLLRKVTFLRLGIFWANMLIGLFNLIPIPPLDGWHIISLLHRE